MSKIGYTQSFLSLEPNPHPAQETFKVKRSKNKMKETRNKRYWKVKVDRVRRKLCVTLLLFSKAWQE